MKKKGTKINFYEKNVQRKLFENVEHFYILYSDKGNVYLIKGGPRKSKRKK